MRVFCNIACTSNILTTPVLSKITFITTYLRESSAVKTVCTATNRYPILAPSTRIRIFLRTGFFFSGYGFCPHVSGVFCNRTRGLLKTVSRLWIFLTVWTEENGEKRFENATCGRGFFRKRKRKPPLIFKNIQIRVDRRK